MTVLLSDFILETFGPQSTAFSQEDMMNSLMCICFSHRYTKGDKFILEAESIDDSKVDFSIVRDVMYKYSQKSVETFFSHPIESFLFAYFALSEEGKEFLVYKPDMQKDESKLEKVKKGLSDLRNDAINSLATGSPSTSQPYLQYLQSHFTI